MEAPRFDVFLSHMTGDKPVVEALARLLKARGIEPWLDKWNLVPGAPWQKAIEEALENCVACAVCIGSSGTGAWQNEEMRAAIDLRVKDREGDFRVIPVLLPGARRGERSRLPTFLTATTWVEFREALDDEQALHRLICGIRGLEPGPGPGGAVAEGACPYRGLQVFDVEDSLFFFGREALTGWLLDKLRPTPSDNRFLAVVGPSGSGKSSLARAGLLASLKSGQIPGSDAWPAAVFKPGAQPLESLAVALARAIHAADTPSALRELIRDLEKDARMLHLTTRLALRDVPADQRLVVLVDQFEEVFTLCQEEAQRRALIENLLHAATAADGRTVVVLTLRSDFYGRCAAHADLAAALSDRQVLVGTMAPEELRRAIERPAELAGCELEPGVVDLLLRDVEGEPGCLPLLEHALLQLWLRRKGRRLTHEAYRLIGGVNGALESHAEGVYASFGEEKGEICRRIFLRLVQVDEAGAATKRRLAQDSLVRAADPEAVRQAAATVLGRLVDERLLTSEAAGEEKRPTVELAHEALLTAWKRLRDWIDADRQDLRLRRRLDEAVGEWLGSGREPSYLFSGARLVQVEEWAGRHPGELSPEGRDFLAASISQRDVESAKLRRQRRKAMIAVAAVGVAAMIAAAAMLWLWKGSQRQLRRNVATQLAGQARVKLPSSSLISLLLGAEAVRRDEDLADAKGALLGALARSDGQPLGKTGVQAMAVTGDRLALVILHDDGMATLWNLGSGIPKAPESTFPIEKNVVSLALSNDHRWLLTEDEDGMVRLRDLKRKIQPAARPDERWPPGDPFSPDGQWLITLRGDTPVLHDLGGAPSVWEMPGLPPVQAVAYSPDSRHLAVALEGGAAEIWDLSARTRRPLPGAPAPILSLAFSTNGRSLTAAIRSESAMEEQARVWQLDPAGKAAEPIALMGCTSMNYRVAVSPEGTRIFTWGGADASCLWPLDQGGPPNLDELPAAVDAAFSVGGRWLAWSETTGAIGLIPAYGPRLALPGQGQPTPRLFFVGGDRWLATQAGDEAPRLWDLSRYPSGFVLAAAPDGSALAVGLSGGIVRVSKSGETDRDLQPTNPSLRWTLSPKGDRIATGFGEKRLQYWDLTHEIPTRLEIPWPDRLYSLDFSPDGDRLAVGAPGLAWLWSPGETTPRTVASDPQGQPVTALAFDRTATRLATGSAGGRIRIFGLDDPELAPLYVQEVNTRVRALAFSPDGQELAIADAEGTRLWRPGTNPPKSFDSGDREIRILAFSESQGGRWLASGGVDGTLQLWALDQSSGVPVAWKGHAGRVLALSFSADGKELISTGATDTVRRWPLDPEEMIRRACEKAGRSLTAEEWTTYAPPDQPFRKGLPCGKR